MNLLFGRGIYKESNVDWAKQMAVDRETETIVYKMVDHNIQISNPNAYYLSNFTDSNWTNGYSNMNNVLLFDRNDEL